MTFSNDLREPTSGSPLEGAALRHQLDCRSAASTAALHAAVPTPQKPGRKPLFGVAMSAAERQRRVREKARIIRKEMESDK